MLMLGSTSLFVCLFNIKFGLSFAIILGMPFFKKFIILLTQ
jgi:hypothetical protein